MIRKIDMFAKINATPFLTKEFQKERLVSPPGWGIFPIPGWEKAFIPTGKYAIAPTPGWEKAFIPKMSSPMTQLDLPYGGKGWSWKDSYGNITGYPMDGLLEKQPVPEQSLWQQFMALFPQGIPKMANIQPGTPQGFAEKITSFDAPMIPIIFRVR